MSKLDMIMRYGRREMSFDDGSKNALELREERYQSSIINKHIKSQSQANLKRYSSTSQNIS